MAQTQDIYTEFRYLKSRTRASFLSATVSIGLVLFFLGLFVTLILFGKTFVENARESMQVKIFLYDGVNSMQLEKLKTYISKQTYCKEQTFTSKEQAAKIFLERNGEDFKKVLGNTNPLLASVNLRLKPEYLVTDSINKIQKDLKSQYLIVESVDFPALTLNKIDQNIRNFSFIALIIAGIVVFIAFYLVSNTIRLSIYAQRLGIRTMQLIGATEEFIRKPFLRIGLYQGMLAGVFAVLLLLVLTSFIHFQLASLHLNLAFLLKPEFVGLLLGIVLFGAILGYGASFVAVNRFLNKSLDEIMR